MAVLQRPCIALCWPILLLTIEQCILATTAAPCKWDFNPHQQQYIHDGHAAFYERLFDRSIKLQLGLPSDARNPIPKPECTEVNANPKYLQCKVILPQNEEQKAAVINVAPFIVSLDGQYQNPMAKASVVPWTNLQSPIVSANNQHQLPQFGANLIRSIIDSLIKGIVNSLKQVITPPNFPFVQTAKPDIPSQESSPTTMPSIRYTTEDVGSASDPPNHLIEISTNKNQMEEKLHDDLKRPDKPHNNKPEINNQNDIPAKQVEDNTVPSGVREKDVDFSKQPENNKGKSEDPKGSEVSSQENASSQIEGKNTSPSSNSNGLEEGRSDSNAGSVYSNTHKENSNRQSNLFLLPMEPTMYPIMPPHSVFKSKNNKVAINLLTSLPHRKPQEFRDVPEVTGIEQDNKIVKTNKNLRKNFSTDDSSVMKAFGAPKFAEPLKKNEMKDDDLKIPLEILKNEMRPSPSEVKIMLQDNGGNRHKQGFKYSMNDLAVFLKLLGIHDDASKVKIILNTFANSPYLTMDIDNMIRAYRAGSISKYVMLQYVIFKLVQNQAGIKLLSPGEEKRIYEVLTSLGTPISLEAEESKATSKPAVYGSSGGILRRPSTFYRQKPFLAQPQIIPQLSGPSRSDAVISYAVAPPPGYPVPPSYVNSNFLRYF